MIRQIMGVVFDVHAYSAGIRGDLSEVQLGWMVEKLDDTDPAVEGSAVVHEITFGERDLHLLGLPDIFNLHVLRHLLSSLNEVACAIFVLTSAISRM